ncbi:F-box/kelch-repeat protein At3g23880-like [Neltuma alba]|uniref:F-box/kelch-repeat protein At3g23880-like n=1 Tax=Neltuma alba TaxID=207710 RepID=UPI0010A3E918|nr:F-box/kelch-repeat protein At3g23880-like [Prosopis alba]
MLSAYLPEDVMKDILVRLPLKSLLRFKSVAKSWYALMTDSSFCTKCLEWSNSINKNGCLKLMFQLNPNVAPSISLLSNSSEDPGVIVPDFELPFYENDLKLRWISGYGQCNGIFCLHLDLLSVQGYFDHDEQHRLILWNPLTKEVKVIPTSEHGASDAMFGFGFDPITADYKVVGIFPNKSQKEEQEQSVVQVYNLSTNSWRTIDIIDAPSFEFDHPLCGSYMNRSYLNGAYHWLTNDYYKIDKPIVTFDFSKEVFGNIGFPIGITLAPFNIAVVDKSLAIIATYYAGKFHESVEIWVMNEYGIESSWTKKFTIGSFPNMVHILGFWRDDEILVECSGKLILHNLWNHQRRKFQIHFGRMSLMMMDYEESLFPLGARWKLKDM